MWLHTPDAALPYSRATLVKPELEGQWSVRLGDDQLNRKLVTAEVKDLMIRCEDEEEAMGGNLTQLSEVSDPEIISALWRRLNAGEVYSFAGDLAVGAVLVSMRPEHQLPLFTREMQSQFNFLTMNEGRAAMPHVYTVGGRAYRSMFRDRMSQSVLFLGGAGSGKSFAFKAPRRHTAPCGKHGR